MAYSGNVDEVLHEARAARARAVLVLRETERLRQNLSESVEQAARVRQETSEIAAGAKRRFKSLAS